MNSLIVMDQNIPFNLPPSLFRSNHRDKLLDYLINNNIDTISFDIFDTLLLRNTKPEIKRMYEIAKLHAIFFRKRGLELTTESLFCARIITHKIGYKTAPLVGKYRDASLDHIFNLYMKFIGVNPNEEVFNQLLNIELSYETKNLKLNNEILISALFLMENGFNIFLISDMYFRKIHLIQLLNYFTKINFYTGIYVSSEFSATKLSGELFKIFLNQEQIKPKQVLHVGDNAISDYYNAKKQKINTAFMPRSLFHRGCEHINKYIFLKKYKHFIE